TPVTFTLSLHDALPIFEAVEERLGLRELEMQAGGDDAELAVGQRRELLQLSLGRREIGQCGDRVWTRGERGDDVFEEQARDERRSEEHTSELQSRENLV